MPRRVYIHVGLQKTGTTYLQQALWQSRQRLADEGILVPGETHQFQRFAVWDLLGRRLRGVDQAHVPGKWDALVDAVRRWPGRQAVLSEEFLINARPAHVRRIVRAFEPAEVHVVVTVRDLARMLGSMWQQEIAGGRSWPWPNFVAAVRAPDTGPATAGVAFWLRQDVKKLLNVWGTAVPPERTHVVVVPAPGAPPSRLLELFAAAIDVDTSTLTPPQVGANASIGPAEAELLRRFNESVAAKLNERQYLHLVNQVLRPALAGRSKSTRLLVPAAHRAWVLKHSEETVDYLVRGGYDVHGDLNDLLPGAGLDTGGDPSTTNEGALAQAAMDALGAIAEHYAAYWWRTRRQPRPGAAGARQRVTSATRALGYRSRVAALERADSNRVLARAARLYLRYARRDRGSGA